MDFIEPCFGIGHNLSLICQMTSEDIKHQLIIIIERASERARERQTEGLSIFRNIRRECRPPSIGPLLISAMLHEYAAQIVSATTTRQEAWIRQPVGIRITVIRCCPNSQPCTPISSLPASSSFYHVQSYMTTQRVDITLRTTWPSKGGKGKVCYLICENEPSPAYPAPGKRKIFLVK